MLSCGEVYLRTCQSRGVVTLQSGAKHLVYQMKIYKGKKELFKMGSIIKDDLLFVQNVINDMIDELNLKNRNNEKNNKSAKNGSYKHRKSNTKTLKQRARSLSDAASTTTPVRGIVLGHVVGNLSNNNTISSSRF